MSLKGQTYVAVKKLFRILSSFLEDFTYKSIVKGAFNPATGLQAETVTEIALSGIGINYGDYSRGDGTYEKTDLALIFLREGTTFTPSTNDKVVFRGETYKIISIEQDAADAAYALQIRRV